MNKIQEILENSGFDVRSYSGRAMYGKSCLGVEVDNLGEFISILLESVQGEEDTRDLQEAFLNLKQDQMGHGIVLYFPDVEFTDAA